MFSDLFPILLTPDVTRALRFYRDQLGGSVTFEYPGPDGNLAYVGLEIGSANLGIGLSPNVADTPLPRPISLWTYTDDCDAAVENLRQAGTTVLEEPTDQAWGERVARVLDPDGNEVVIGERLSTAPEA